MRGGIDSPGIEGNFLWGSVDGRIKDDQILGGQLSIAHVHVLGRVERTSPQLGTKSHNTAGGEFSGFNMWLTGVRSKPQDFCLKQQPRKIAFNGFIFIYIGN